MTDATHRYGYKKNITQKLFNICKLILFNGVKFAYNIFLNTLTFSICLTCLETIPARNFHESETLKEYILKIKLVIIFHPYLRELYQIVTVSN